MKEYIEREAATDGLREHLRYMLDGAPISQGTRDIYAMAYRHCIDKINSIPAADFAEVLHGEWLPCKASVYPFGNNVRCSECGFTLGSSFGWHYCPNCGAKMDGGANDGGLG